MRSFIIVILPIIIMLFLVQYYPYNKTPTTNMIISYTCETISMVTLGIIITSYIFRNKNKTMYKIHMLLDPPLDEQPNRKEDSQ